MSEFNNLLNRINSINRTARRLGYSKLTTSIDEMWCIFQAASYCAICHTKFETLSDSQLDHCHETGVFRGFICRRCNLVLGMVDDQPDLLVKLQDYLS